jgi:hypothetical protein
MKLSLTPEGLDPLDVSLSATRARAEHLRNLIGMFMLLFLVLSICTAFINLPMIAALFGVIGFGISCMCIGVTCVAHDIAICEIWSDNGGRRVR